MEICAGESILLDGILQTQSGVYIDSLTSINGCDSIMTTTLTVHPTYELMTTASICAGDSILLSNTYQTVGGIYHDTLSTTNGCDSIITTELIILPVSSTAITASICAGETYFAGGMNQSVSGIYIDSLMALNGCDSIVATTLTVLPISSTAVSIELCEGETYFAGGMAQTTSGVYQDTLVSANGCDSICLLYTSPSPRDRG